MPEQQLHDMLVELDQELRSGTAIADEDRALLQKVKLDLEAVLARKPETASESETDDPSLKQQLDGAVERFESDHPGLANLMRAALDALNRLGV